MVAAIGKEHDHELDETKPTRSTEHGGEELNKTTSGRDEQYLFRGIFFSVFPFFLFNKNLNQLQIININ